MTNQVSLDLKGAAAIVTGGAQGVGLGISERLVAAGARVLIADISPEAGEQAAEQLRSAGGEAAFVQTDVSQESDLQAMVEKCNELYGSLDILVNNAGVYPINPVAETNAEALDKVLAINLRATMLATGYATKLMQQGGGAVVNVSSIDAHRPTLPQGLAHYGASKAGVEGFTRQAARELGPHGIRVNAVVPGGIATPGAAALQANLVPPGTDPKEMAATFAAKLPVGRIGEPHDVGNAVLFLVSDLSSYITGQALAVDGGALLS